MKNEDKEKLGAVVGTAGGVALGYLLGRKKKTYTAPTYSCPFCGLIFETRDELLTHITAEHCPPGTQWFVCYPTQNWYLFVNSAPTWIDCHDSLTGGVSIPTYGSQTGFYWWDKANIYRSGIYFDLSPLPQGKLILSANLVANFSHHWKYADGGLIWVPNDQILLDFPNHSWPPVPEDYGKIRTLTDEIIRWNSEIPPYEEIVTVPLPQHTINTMQGMPRLAIAEVCSADHEGPAGTVRSTFGCNTYKQYAEYTAYLYVEVQL
jgi:hypothetical protein